MHEYKNPPGIQLSVRLKFSVGFGTVLGFLRKEEGGESRKNCIKVSLIEIHTHA